MKHAPSTEAGSLSLPLQHALQMPPHYGFTMRGWDFDSGQVNTAIIQRLMLNPAFELSPNICPWNCSFCFTESVENLQDRKRRHLDEMSLDEKLALIDQAAKLGARSINIVGAGEPTVDPHLKRYLQRMADHGVTPILYTEASTKLGQHSFAQELYEYGTTIVVKVNSLVNADYQDSVVRGTSEKIGMPKGSFLEARNRALDVLLDVGFADESPTRLAFDTIICRENLEEIEDIHRYARHHNIFVLFVNYLPSGRTRDGHKDEISLKDLLTVYGRLSEIDHQEFGIERDTIFPYAGCVPCTIRGLGVLVTIQGDVYDCPGKSQKLGNLREDSLQAVWERAADITRSFDGGCYPREVYWRD